MASTPIDLSSFDIPEAHKPLPASPPAEVASPVTVVLEIRTSEQELPVPSISPLSASSSQSYITSPQEPQEEAMSLSIPHLESKSIQATAVPSPLLTPTMTASTNPNPLHCRVCLADSCDDITASMCGHIFCNRYVTPTLSLKHSILITSRSPAVLQMRLSKPTAAQCV